MSKIAGFVPKGPVVLLRRQKCIFCVFFNTGKGQEIAIRNIEKITWPICPTSAALNLAKDRNELGVASSFQIEARVPFAWLLWQSVLRTLRLFTWVEEIVISIPIVHQKNEVDGFLALWCSFTNTCWVAIMCTKLEIQKLDKKRSLLRLWCRRRCDKFYKTVRWSLQWR